MKAAVVFYSLEGSTAHMAARAAEKLHADLIELRCVKPYPTEGKARMLRASRDTMMGIKPELLPYELDARAYDLMVVAGPIWCGKMAAPLSTFARDHAEELEGMVCAALVVSGAPKESYVDAPRNLLGRGEDMPVLHLTTRQVTDEAVLDEEVGAFCSTLLDQVI